MMCKKYNVIKSDWKSWGNRRRLAFIIMLGLGTTSLVLLLSGHNRFDSNSKMFIVDREWMFGIAIYTVFIIFNQLLSRKEKK
jgi:hypothetical protein